MGQVVMRHQAGGEAARQGELKSKRGRQGQIYDSLRSDILTLALEPGQVLDETSLARKYRSSRAPVREALIRLAADGLVTMPPNRSAMVAAVDLLKIPSYLDALNLLQRTTHHLAALRRNSKQLEWIAQAQDDFLNALATGRSIVIIEANVHFHLAISDACGNPYFADAYGRLLAEGVRLQHLHLKFMGWSPTEPSLQEHGLMVTAIEKQDGPLAEQLARSHAQQFDHAFLRFLATRLAGHIEVVNSQGQVA